MVSWGLNGGIVGEGTKCTYNLDHSRGGTDGSWLALSSFRGGKSTQLVVQVDSVIQEPRGAELFPREDGDLEVGLAVLTEFVVLVRRRHSISLQRKLVDTSPRQ